MFWSDWFPTNIIHIFRVTSLAHWQWCDYMIVKQRWQIWVNGSHEWTHDWNVLTSKQSIPKSCFCSFRYTVRNVKIPAHLISDLHMNLRGCIYMELAAHVSGTGNMFIWMHIYIFIYIRGAMFAWCIFPTNSLWTDSWVSVGTSLYVGTYMISFI